MNVICIVRAISALDRAANALLRGNLSVEEQVKLGTECTHASVALSLELARAEVTVPLEKEE